MTEQVENRMIGKLPQFFTFKTAKDLVRIGRNYDGGYLVCKKDIDKTDVLIGLGISDDWSFESDFVNRKDIQVYAYDASVSQKYFFKQLIKAIARIDKPKNFLHYLRVMLAYRKFFNNKRRHIEKYVGLNAKGEKYCTLKSVLKKIDSNNIFLKIDVEGAEYRFLDTLIENQKRITGLVIELHDCDIHIGKIRKFIENFNLCLVHVHANNYAPIRLDDGLPLVLELTFSGNAELSEPEKLPHLLDMPNNPFVDDIELVVER